MNPGRNLSRWLLLLPVMLAALLPFDVWAALPAVDGAVKKDYARIVFSWPERVPFRTRMEGRTLKITFDKQANPNLGALKSKLSPYVESASMAPDGKTALITLRHAYPVRTFISSTSSGIDLLQINAPRFSGKSSAPAMASAAPAAGTPAPKPTPRPAPAKVAKPVAKPAPAKPALSQKPTAKPEAKKAEVVKPATPPAKAPAKAPEPAAAPPKESAPAEQKPGEQKQVAESKTPAAPATPPPAPTPPAAAPKETPATAVNVPAPAGPKGLMVAVLKRNTAADFNFPWTERTAAAAFTYGQDFWLVFNKPAKVDVDALTSVAPPFITRIEQLPSDTSTILRFGLREEMSPVVRKKPGTYEWIFSLGRRPQVPETPVLAETRTEPPLKPHLFLSVLESSQPISLTHPDTGEEMVVLPIYRTGQGTFPERNFIDARLPRTAQGVLVIKQAGDLRVAKMRNGVRISTPDGLRLARTLPALDLNSLVSAEDNSDSFFPYEKWKVADPAEFTARKHALLAGITEASDPEASRLRRKLAELYMGEGYFSEALTMLNVIRDTDPQYFSDYQLSALRGAANFMLQRFQEAALDFGDSALEGSEEIDHWKRFAAVMNGNENKLLKYEEFNKFYGKGYPPEMRRRLMLIAADQAIGQEMFQKALLYMKSLNKEEMEPIAAYRDFMIGRIYAENGKLKEAEEMLTKVLDSSDSRFLRARAAFTLATTRFKAGEITKDELIRELDNLRIVWRNDQLELSLLELLGNLYVNEQRYIDGLRAWKELVTNYPGTAAAQETAVKMSQTFQQLFRDGYAKELSPLNALALFYEFKDMTPVGSDGDMMIQDLADRLASVDLLDRAAALLEHQVMYRLEKEERSRVGARLALIYLLDKKPQKAIEVLELTGYGNNSKELQQHRNHLAANAYAATGDWQTALSMLEEDFTSEAKLIKMDIYWDNKDWPNVITLGEDLLASRSNITAPMKDDEARTLMRLAVAYTMEGDRIQLSYLRDYFGPLMEKSPYRTSFDFITDDRGPIDPRNIQTLAQDISKTKSFLETYRAAMEKDGLSSSVN